MASDFDETDEAFFDKLVNSDDDDEPPVAAAAAGGLAALSLTEQPDAAPPREPEPFDEPVAAAGAEEEPERVPSPELDPADALQLPETQARAAEPLPDLAASVGADPSGDLLPEDGEAFFGAAPVSGDHQDLQASPSPSLSLPAGTDDVSAPDRTVSAQTESNASSQLDSSTAAEGSGDQSANAQLESTDPRYLESLYPGWKYDEATQQWYQVDTFSAQSYAAQDTGAAVAGHGSDDVLQQQQQLFGASYAQNTSHAETGLEHTQVASQPETEADNQPPVAPPKEEEAQHEPVPAHTEVGYGASNATSQFDSSTTAEGYGDQSANAQLEYTDPRYLESLYPGWKYDEATQQWYQVDTLNTQTYAAHDTSAAAADMASGSVQQQQQFTGSYLETTSHAEPALEPTEPTSESKPQLEPAADQASGSVQQQQQFTGSHLENTSHAEPALEPTEPTSESKSQLEPAAAPPETEVDNQPAVALQEEELAEHEPMPVHTKHEAEEIPANAGDATAAREGGSPGSEKGIHTAIKQVQWNDFGASTGGGGADLFGELLPDGAEDDFFGGTVPGNQGVQSSLVGAKNFSAPDHSFSAGVDDSAMISAGHSFSGGVDKNANSHFGSSGSTAGYGDQSTNAQLDSTDPKYLESLYPGWKYDEATQQWYQVGTHSAQSSVADNTGAAVALGSDYAQQHQQQFSASYLQNNLHATLETIAEESSTSTTSWAQGGTNTGPAEYPPNMLFYAEYPGWYFDTNTQQWQTLESYQQGLAQTPTSAAASDGLAGAGHNVANYTEDSYASSYNQQSQWKPNSLGNTMQPDVLGGKSLLGSSYSSNQQAGNQIGQQANAESLQSSINYEPNHIETFMPSTGQYNGSERNQASSKGFEPFTGNQSCYKGLEHSTSKELRYKGFEPSTSFQNSRKEFQPPKDFQAGHMADEPLTRDGFVSSNGVANTQNFVPKESIYKTQVHDFSTAHTHAASNSWDTQTSMGFAQQQLIGTNGPSQQFGFSPHEQRSSAGRPPHTVVSFGFGGKLVVLKETSSMAANFDSGNQGNSGRVVSVLNIPEVVADKIDHSSITAFSYFHALCRHPIPGPLVGGSAASKDVNKWLDDMTGVYESSQSEFQRGDVQKVLISLLKILCQHYGKLRSPFGSDPSQEGIDGPEMAVTKLFSSCKSSANMKGYGAVVHCMRNLPSESQIQTTAQEVQNLLVSGRRKEALQHAQEGQLWGPALILALQLGDKFYADTVKKMAHCHFVSGSPLRTLCLLIAGQPADVFNFENPVNSSSLYSPHQPVEAAPKGMMDDWQENLAIITANRTKGDDLVITHLGDCLWKEKNEVASAHSCYLVAELNIDPYSESARMCLIGADHLRCPRTFASPEAIQRTEVYEYAKILGNSQYILLPFQPYKLIYAYMLVEVGKISDALKYCQASLKVLRSSGRAPELEAWKQLFMTLEDRIRTHQQGGYATNLAPGKIVGKLFTSLDKSLSRMMGTQAAPLPQLPQGAANERDAYSPPDTKIANSQSVMSMAPLVSSASEQSMSEIGGNSGYGREVAHNRSISEPDFGKTPQQQGAVSSKAQSTSGSGSSRFGWLVQKTMGLVSKSHRQAKLGEQNKFYYDEKLKRWVEEGAEIPAEEPPLPPPPSKVPFQSSVPDPNSNARTTIGGGSSNPLEPSSGMPPMPPTQNQFSARGRMGVRSRYVDTFNKGSGGGGANAFGAVTSYSKPAAPSINPMSGAKFFVPTPATVASEHMAQPGAQSETTRQDEPSSSPTMETSFSSPPPLIQMQSTIQRHPSGDNIPRHPRSDSIQRYPSGDNIPRHPSSDNLQRYPSMENIVSPSGSVNSSMSRSRASSWSGTLQEQLSSTAATRSPDGQIMQSPSMPGRHPHSRSSSTSSVQFNGLGEELHEVEL